MYDTENIKTQRTKEPCECQGLSLPFPISGCWVESWGCPPPCHHQVDISNDWLNNVTHAIARKYTYIMQRDNVLLQSILPTKMEHCGAEFVNKRNIIIEKI